MLTGATIAMSPSGLRLTGTSWTRCGEGLSFAGVATIAPEAKGWITASIESSGCVADPVISFVVDYVEAGRAHSLSVSADQEAPSSVGAKC